MKLFVKSRHFIVIGNERVTMSQGPPWLADDAMHGNGSVTSKTPALGTKPGHKVSWLLCIGRLVSKNRTVMHLRSGLKQVVNG